VLVEGAPPNCLRISYTPGPEAPLGAYQITLTQGNARLSDTFQLAVPTRPAGTLYLDCAWLAGLPANQAVRLLAFGLVPPGPTGSSMGPSVAVWQFDSEKQVLPSPGGTLLACPAPANRETYAELAYLAMPSGSVIALGDPEILSEFQGVCEGGPPTRLGSGQNARIIAREVSLFSDPAALNRSLSTQAKDRQLAVLNGPICAPQGGWIWQVRTPDGQTGWTAEGDASSYFLEPVP
jgi:hypothetical protein